MYEYNDLEYLKNKLKTDLEKGLTQKEADRRLLNGEKNILESKKKDSVIQMFFKQLKDPMIYILLVAIVVSFFLKEYNDAIVVMIVVFFNALIGMLQEMKTEKSLEMLKKLSGHKCQVIRDGERKLVDTADLVKGDLVYLESGNSVGADLRIVKSWNLKIDESSITGESKPVSKYSDILDVKIKNLGDKNNLAYMSTLVVSGRAIGVVIATGMKSEIGRIASMLKEKAVLTPLQKRLLDLSKVLGILTVLICFIMFVLAWVDNRNVMDMLISSISLAVAAIPEGLPAVVTIVLAIGVQRMIKVNAIVKRLPSVETLGAVSVVCSDKTGTLTENKLKCDGVFESFRYISAADIENNEIKSAMKLCNNAYKNNQEYVGSPIEIALLELLEKNNFCLDESQRVAEKEFESTRKMMSVTYKVDSQYIQYTKGAYDRLINKCKYIYDNGSIRLIKKEDLNLITKEIDKQSDMAKRVLAFAMRKVNHPIIEESELTFLGFATFIDPPRKGVKEAISKFKNAGVKTVMITGDYAKTGLAIAKEVGIASDENECINGEEIDSLSNEQLVEIVEKKSVFARVSPQHKARIVQALQAKDNIVAMTGDGVNDAPSLKKADIGISMGITGSDVSKEASDMILADDNFVTIETAIEEGRTIYNNIKKSVLFLLSSNFAEIIVMLSAIIIGFPLPLSAMHILVVNLLTDSLPALALGADCKDGDVMEDKPRKPNESLFSNGGLFNTVIYGFVIAILTFAAFLLPSIKECCYYGVDINLSNIKQILLERNILLTSQTYAFIVLSLGELFYAFSMRNINKSVFRQDVFANKYLNASVLMGILVIYLMIIIKPLRMVFNLFSISILEFLILIGISSSVLFLKEVFKPLFHVKLKKLEKKD